MNNTLHVRGKFPFPPKAVVYNQVLLAQKAIRKSPDTRAIKLELARGNRFMLRWLERQGCTVEGTTIYQEYPKTYVCPECGEGEYTIASNREAPIPNPPTTVHDDEGRWVGMCPYCDAELSPETLTGGRYEGC